MCIVRALMVVAAFLSGALLAQENKPPVRDWRLKPAEIDFKMGALSSAWRSGNFGFGTMPTLDREAFGKAFLIEMEIERSRRYAAPVGAIVMQYLRTHYPNTDPNLILASGKSFEKSFAEDFEKYRPGYRNNNEKLIDSALESATNLISKNKGGTSPLNLMPLYPFFKTYFDGQLDRLDAQARQGILEKNPNLPIGVYDLNPYHHQGQMYGPLELAGRDPVFANILDRYLGEILHGGSSRHSFTDMRGRHPAAAQEFDRLELPEKIEELTKIAKENHAQLGMLSATVRDASAFAQDVALLVERNANKTEAEIQRNRALLEEIKQGLEDQRKAQARADDIRGYQMLNNALASIDPSNKALQASSLVISTALQVIAIAGSSAGAGGKAAGYAGAGVGLAVGLYQIFSAKKSADEITYEQILAIREDIFKATALILSSIRHLEMNDNRNFEELFGELNRIHSALAIQIEEVSQAIKQTQNNNRNYSQIHSAEYRALDQKLIKLLSHQMDGDEFLCFSGASLSEEYRKNHYLECLRTFYRCAHGEFDSDLMFEQSGEINHLFQEDSANRESVLVAAGNAFPLGATKEKPEGAKIQNLLRVLKLLGSEVDFAGIQHPDLYRFCVDRMVALASLEPELYRKFDPRFERFAEIVGVGVKTEQTLVEASSKDNATRVLNAYAEQALAVRDQIDRQLYTEPAGTPENLKLRNLDIWKDWKEQANTIPANVLPLASIQTIGPCDSTTTLSEESYLPLLKGMPEAQAAQFQAAIWKMVPSVYKILLRNAGGEMNVCYENTFHHIVRVHYGPNEIDPKFQQLYGKSSYTLNFRYRPLGTTSYIIMARRLYFVKDETLFFEYLKKGPKPEYPHIAQLENEANVIKSTAGPTTRLRQIEAELTDLRSLKKMGTYYEFHAYPHDMGKPNPKVEGRKRWESEIRNQILREENGPVAQDPSGELARKQEEDKLVAEIEAAKLRRHIAILEDAKSGGQKLFNLIEGLNGGRRLIGEFTKQFFPQRYSEKTLAGLLFRYSTFVLPSAKEVREDLIRTTDARVGFTLYNDPKEAREQMVREITSRLDKLSERIEEVPERKTLLPSPPLRRGIESAREFLRSKGALPLLEAYLEAQPRRPTNKRARSKPVVPVWHNPGAGA